MLAPRSMVEDLRNDVRCPLVPGRELFTVPVTGGRLGGWIAGDGVPVLLLHGGPGLSYEYLEGLADELGAGFQVAAYPQRGLDPSTAEGPGRSFASMVWESDAAIVGSSTR